MFVRFAKRNKFSGNAFVIEAIYIYIYMHSIYTFDYLNFQSCRLKVMPVIQSCQLHKNYFKAAQIDLELHILCM